MLVLVRPKFFGQKYGDLLDFLLLPDYLYEKENMEQQKTYKRQYREMDDATKKKISRTLTGRPKTDQHKQNISNGLKAMWEKIPHRPDSDDYISSGKIV